jgi:hypothetical protein
MATFDVDILIVNRSAQDDLRWFVSSYLRHFGILIANQSPHDSLRAYVSSYLKRFGNTRIVALDPYLHSALLNGGFDASYIWDLRDDSQVQEEYRQARTFCRKLNQSLSVNRRNFFKEIDLLDLVLPDIAYYARYYYAVGWLARKTRSQGVYPRLLIATTNSSFMNTRQTWTENGQEISYTVKRLHRPSIFREVRRLFVQPLSSWPRSKGAMERPPRSYKFGLSTKTRLKRVLFAVTGSDTRMDEMVVPPVLRRIQEESLLVPLVVTNSKKGANHLEEGTVSALYPSKDLRDETCSKSMEIASRLKLECNRLLLKCASGAPECLTILYYLDHLDDYITRAWDAVAFLDEVFRDFRPDVVVAIPEGTMFSRTAALLAKRDHVSSLSFYQLAMVHAWFEESCADRIALYGSHGYDAMIKNGFSPNKLTIVGNPRYDDWLKADADTDRETICAKLQIPRERKIITIAAHLSWKGTRIWVQAVVRTFAEHRQEGKYALIIKPHPADLLEDYLTILNGIKPSDVYLVDGELDIRTLMNATDILITDLSAVGVEAIVLGKPTICLNLTGTPQHLIRYDEEGGAILVTRADRIWDTIQDVLYDDVTIEKLARERERGIERFAFKNDGQSSARFLNAIHKMMASNPR